ncbi:hypothetical protein M3Y94_00958000 [Aphelenchoides besseyi]|nr:hypothetical protein M3Y94_00958000 [Aphelenchoides besseyi]KAI6224747.1 hypothetical protein M3Y95_00785100 [Aphelenchoides besseyi]
MHRKTGPDRNVCTYQDFTIFESDFRSINSSWLTDTAVNFAASYLKDEIIGKGDDKVSLVYAFLCEMVKYTNPESTDEIRELLQSVNVQPDKWCCFLLNDNSDPTAVSGGTHWTLLLHDPIQKILWQLDPMVDIRPMHCLAFFTRIRTYLDDDYRVMPCPKMSMNGSCGIYVVEYLNNIFKYIRNGGQRVQEADLSGIDDRWAISRRVFYCDLINRLAVEQGKEPVVL